MLKKKQRILKRVFDFMSALFILPFLLIPLILLWFVATLSTGQNGWFTQQRIGRYGIPFSFYKIRSLKGSHHADVHAMKQSETLFGRWIRATKLDELPQVFNVLFGTMSWVGPRPDVAGYADRLKGDDRLILQILPGVTGPATIKYKDEEWLLMQQEDPTLYNDTVIWPDKVAINKRYVEEWRFLKDVGYLWRSVF